MVGTENFEFKIEQIQKINCMYLTKICKYEINL